jgi:hypothetical protein
MLATIVTIALASATAVPSASPDLATPMPPAGEVPAPLVVEAATERWHARATAARNGQVVGASVVLGAAGAAYLAAILQANLTCDDWALFNPDCETSDATRRVLFHGAVAGLAVVPPLFAGRWMRRADPEANLGNAFLRGVPWHLLGVAAFAITPKALRDEGAVVAVATGSFAFASSILLAPRFAAGEAPPPLPPPPIAFALPERDPALQR